MVLSRIYTRTGDDGSTALGDGSRAAKTDPRLAAYADVDEANCAIGMAITMGGLPADLVTLLSRIQNELFDVGADLCNPVSENPPYPPLRITEAYVAALEEDCDTHNAACRSCAASSSPAARQAPPCCTWPGRSCAGRNGAPGRRWRPTATR